jgi:O-antigen biosynthesis protein
VTPSVPVFSPIKILQVELSHSLLAVSVSHPRAERNYERMHIYPRLWGRPLGLLELDRVESDLSPSALAEKIWENYRHQICQRFREVEMVEPRRLTEAGLAQLPDALNRQEVVSPEESEPRITVVVATRDRVETLAPCIESLLGMNYSNFDLLIVDNAPSSSATSEFFQKSCQHDQRFRYLREDTPGLAVAHNRALREVDAPIVAFTDDDVLVDPNWLDALAANFVKSQKIVCVTGLTIPYELETPSQVWIEQFGGFGKGFERIIYDLDENHPGQPLYPYAAGKFGSGANMAFRTDVLRGLGGFDAALGAGTIAMGGDDLAAFFTVISDGYQLVYEPAALIRHRHRRDYPGLSRQTLGYGVGLGAYLAKTIVDQPARFLELLAKAPAGLRYYFSPKSAKNNKKLSTYPRELRRLELQGLFYGPLAYLRSRIKLASRDQRN